MTPLSEIHRPIEAYAGLRQVLIQQYMLHEINHHPGADTMADSEELRPRAHTLVDIYKCLHQGVFGVGHSIDNPKNFKNRLRLELADAEPTDKEPVLEWVATQGGIMRLNLRPYRYLLSDDAENACELLHRVCLDSAEIEKGDPQQLLEALFGFKDLNRLGELKVGGRRFVFPESIVDHFLQEVINLGRHEAGMPVFSHSAIYRKLNRPSYRVVNTTVLKASPLSFLLKE